MATTQFIRWFRDISMADVGLVSGENASLGEMCRELIWRIVRAAGEGGQANVYRTIT